jgi:hypothetical protein
MPDLQDQPARNADDESQAPTQTGSGGAPESPGVDHLAHLFTMSTTSAPAATEYAAINTTSVIALLLGLASVVALYDWLLLIVPLVAVVVGVVAWVQIGRSNGTQTGRGMALAGIALGLLLGALVGVRAVADAARTRSDRREIAQLIGTVGQKVSAGDYDGAYALFSDKFKTYVTREQFAQTWSGMQADPTSGRIQSFTWNGRAEFDKTAAGVEVAGAGADWRWEKYPQPLFYQMFFIKPGDHWIVDSIPTLFKVPRRGRRGATDANQQQQQPPDASPTPAEDVLAPDNGAASPSSPNDPTAR